MNALPDHLLTGRKGELLAEVYLLQAGYTIVGKNVRLPYGHDEIDLIAHDPADDVLVFVEVKTRTEPRPDLYDPAKQATEKKRSNLQRAARKWVAVHEYDGGYRMDLICVAYGRVIEHIKELRWGYDRFR